MKGVFRCAVGAALMIGLATACSGGGGVQKLGVGGVVFTEGGGYNLTYLPGVTVSLTDEDGDAETAVTGSNGLFEFSEVREGPYVATFSLAGYETVSFYVSVTAVVPEDSGSVIFAFGLADSDDDVDPIEHTPSYTFLGHVILREVSAVASVVPFDISMEDGDRVIDGLGGATAVYDVSADGDVLITMDRPVVSFNQVAIIDGTTFVQYPATLDSTRTIFTISGAGLAALTTNSQVPHALSMSVVHTFSPINGSAEFFDADLIFRAVP